MCLKTKTPHDVNTRHNSCKQALRNPKLEAGSGLGDDHKGTRPADTYIDNWGLVGKSAALYISNTSWVKVRNNFRSGGAAAVALRIGNVLQWSWDGSVVDSFGAWGDRATKFFSRLASI